MTYLLLKKEKMFIGVTRHENEDKTNFDESNENFKKLINFNVKKNST